MCYASVPRDVPVCGGSTHLEITWLGEQSFWMGASASLLTSAAPFPAFLCVCFFSQPACHFFRLCKFHQMSFVSSIYSLLSVTVGFKVTLPCTPFSTIPHHKHASSKSVLQSIKDKKKHHKGFFIHYFKRLSVGINLCCKIGATVNSHFWVSREIFQLCNFLDIILKMSTKADVYKSVWQESMQT